MEGLLTNYYEYHFLYISGIHHVESRNVQGMALMKLFPSRHQHGPGDGGDHRLRHQVTSFMPGNGLAVHHPVRRRKCSRRIPRSLQRDEEHRRDPGPAPSKSGPCSRASRYRPPRSRAPPHRGDPTQSRPASLLQDVPDEVIMSLSSGTSIVPGHGPHRRRDADRSRELALVKNR